MRVLHEYRQEGGRIQWVAQTASEYADVGRNIGEAAALKPIGIYHHGSQTDKLWKAGRIDDLVDALKRMRQTGARAGVGTHIPEVVDYIEEKGWDVDFYMTCLYNLSRTEEEAARVAGHAVKGEFFHDADREVMLARVKKTSKQCLIFKVYGATRQCATAETRRAAMELAFRYAKPSDAVVIGMFPKHTEQVRENCGLVMEAARGVRS
jgi:general stress protein YciG